MPRVVESYRRAKRPRRKLGLRRQFSREAINQKQSLQRVVDDEEFGIQSYSAGRWCGQRSAPKLATAGAIKRARRTVGKHNYIVETVARLYDQRRHRRGSDAWQSGLWRARSRTPQSNSALGVQRIQDAGVIDNNEIERVRRTQMCQCGARDFTNQRAPAIASRHSISGCGIGRRRVHWLKRSRQIGPRVWFPDRRAAIDDAGPRKLPRRVWKRPHSPERSRRSPGAYPLFIVRNKPRAKAVVHVA